MKTTVSPYETSALCLRIVCANGATLRLTRYPRDIVMSNGNTYQTGSGFDFSGYEATAGFSPSAIDLEGIFGFAGITANAVAAGQFDGARCYLFACDYLNPVEDYEPIVASILGKATLIDNKYRIEEMGLIDALNQPVGDTYTPTCTHRFGDAACGKSLPALTVTGTLTAISSETVLRDATRSEAADYFAYGVLTFTSGVNAGLRGMEVRRHESDGTLEVFEAFPYPPSVGDAYTLTPGCRRRREDCSDKWANIINFGGFPDMPPSSVYASRGTK